MQRDVYVTGLGVVSAIGNNVQENLAALMECRHGIGSVTLFETIHGSPVGEVKMQCPKNLSRTSFLGLAAAKEALQDSGISQSCIDEGKIRIGIVSATTVGGMDLTEQSYPYLKPSLAAQHPACSSTGYIADNLHINGYRATLSTACSSAANAILLGEKLIRHNILDCVIVGGCDSLCKFTYNGFNSLKILSEKHCRPFDDNRNGLNLGEGAGYIVLQNRESLCRMPYCKIGGCANANDAWHQTASSENGEGDYLAMKNALDNAGLAPEEIDYINAHGTGTPNNDSSEFAAMCRIWGNSMPPFSSTKCYTGHTLAAAGGIEAVYSILSIVYGTVYANLNCNSTEGLQQISKIYLHSQSGSLACSPNIQSTKGGKIRNVLSNSFGFGGNATTVIFSALEENFSLEKVPEENWEKTSKASGEKERDSRETNNSEGYYIYNPVKYNDSIDIKQLIPDANLRRRMSSVIKSGVATAMECLGKNKGICQSGMPDAIITATWLGCLTDSEKFLKSIMDNNETLLNPTPFIQSTFNAIGGQIALITKNHCYNNTYTGQTDTLKNAVTDAMMRISEGKAASVLVGIANETIPIVEQILERTKCGNIPQPGAIFFIISDKYAEGAYGPYITAKEITEAVKNI